MTEGGHFDNGADARRDLDEDREAGAARARGSGKLPGVVQPEARPDEARRHQGWPDGETRSRVEHGQVLQFGVRRADAEAGPAPLRGRRDDVPRAAEATNFL